MDVVFVSFFWVVPRGFSSNFERFIYLFIFIFGWNL